MLFFEFWPFWIDVSQPDEPPLHSATADLSKLLHIARASSDSLLSSQILYPHLYKVQMGMYCKSSRLNSFVTKETSVEILLSAVHGDTEPYFTILPLTGVWRNRWRRPTMSPECLCPIENGFHVECGSNGPRATKRSALLVCHSIEEWSRLSVFSNSVCNVGIGTIKQLDTSVYSLVHLGPLRRKVPL